jgi:zinc transport system ATP-binding protein
MHQLSGGELQKILLVHSALLNPHLLVLDEPSQGVDMLTQSMLYQFIDRLVKNIGCGVILVSHDLHVVMAKSHRVYCLNGHLCCHGHPEDVRQHPSYQGLFGHEMPAILAPYHHHHDHHHHGVDGEPCVKNDCGEEA